MQVRRQNSALAQCGRQIAGWGGEAGRGERGRVGVGAAASTSGSGEVQETLELEPSLVLTSLPRLWVFLEDNRGRDRQEGNAQPGMSGTAQGWDVAGALGARGLC